LLFSVYRIRKYYYKSPNKIVKPFGEIKLSSYPLKLLTILGALLISIPFIIQGLWVYVFKLADNQTDRVVIFKSYFPEFMHGQNVTAYLSSVFCLIGIIFSSINLQVSAKLWKFINGIILVIGCMLLLLNLFQLM